MNNRDTTAPWPRLVQPFLTWVSGRPATGEKPLFKSSSTIQTLTALLSLFGGAFVAALCFKSSFYVWPLGVLSLLFVVGAARKIQVTLCHQCAHYNFTGNARADRILAQWMGALIFVDHFDSYRYEHIDIHHSQELATEIDPDCKFLISLGFRPGMSTKALKVKLIQTIFSPYFHWVFISSRFRANFILAPIGRRVGVMIYLASLIALAVGFNLISSLLVAWVLPLTFLYHIAALLNFSSLHLWLKDTRGLDVRTKITGLSIGRFLADPIPSREGSLVAHSMNWAIWSARFLFYHLPVRIAVLSGDLPVHDFHHRYPVAKDWANYLYDRQRDVEAGTPRWHRPYTETWSLGEALELVFETLSNAPELDEKPVAKLILAHAAQI